MGAQAVRLSNVDIDNALKDKDFEVLFQPIFDLGNGALARVESFIRWRHPSLGVLPPGAFISFFETQGRMSELTRYVLAEALREYQEWRGASAPGFSINLALSDLSDESFASHFTVLLRERGFPAELVTLECPMPAVDADIDATSRQLQRLAETGARLAIEVRGRANDFLKSVQPFPFSEIKTGGAAILRFARTVRGPGLSAISELIELAADQNAAITAVGVEDQASLSALRGLGFAAAQGNHLGKVGALSQFMPSHVNDVRTLLGLDPLSSDDLAALFRTGGPKLAAAAIHAQAPTAAERRDPAPAFDAGEAADANEDELVERLAARIARGAPQEPARPAPDDEAAATRAAAIARARRKTQIREKIAARNALQARADARGDAAAPRDMQERLSREFEAFTDDSPSSIKAETGASESPGPQVLAGPPPEEEFTAAAPPDAGTAAEDQQYSAAQLHGAKMPTESRMAVPHATAHFAPTIRVSGPEAVMQDYGDLDLVEDVEAAAMTGAAPADAQDDEIPQVRPSAQWLEETVRVEIVEERAAAKRPTFLNRTLIPFSALRVTHFWPRGLRRLMRRRVAA
jgi:EAL domain-containing protein (putative c-di-GMP-specific phosphodiesterase class I)